MFLIIGVSHQEETFVFLSFSFIVTEARRQMAEPENHGKLFTLSEISTKTGISMPTLQRYKKMYQDRIPAQGSGRKQRYPESALPVFDEIRNENLGRRGRPRKDPNAPRPERATGSSRGRKAGAKATKSAAKKEAPAARGRGRKATASKRQAAPAPAAAARGGRGRKAAAGGGRGNLMTLTQISEQTGISYPTLVRYVRMHEDRLPHEGKGRGRRFYPEAVGVFRQLREESGRGGRKPAAAKRGRPAASATRGRAAAASSARGGRGGEDTGVLQRLRAIEKSHLDLEKRFRDIAKSLQRLFR
jgi:predicted DNA-binding transcriptional regulator AlpA